MRHAGAMRASTLAGVAIAAGCLLLAFGPGLSDLPAGPGLTLEWMRADPERALITATALAAWLLLAWLAFGLVVCALAAVPGTAGAVAERLSRHVVPATVRRAAGLAVGASLATAPVLSAGTAFAVPAVPAPVVATPQPTSPAGQARGSDSGWPDLGRHPSPAPAPANSPAAPAPPTTAPPTTAPPTAAPQVTPSPAMPPAPSTSAPSAPANAGTYQVRRGDCLWTIAARSLGPGAGPAAIEAGWHRWYHANRDVIGADPSLLFPGQRLTPPPG